MIFAIIKNSFGLSSSYDLFLCEYRGGRSNLDSLQLAVTFDHSRHYRKVSQKILYVTVVKDLLILSHGISAMLRIFFDVSFSEDEIAKRQTIPCRLAQK